MPNEHLIGGQAVIEGVMMKGPDSIAIAVNKKGKIIIKKERLKRKSGFLRLPFIRGIVNLIEILVIGTKALIWSGNQFVEEGKEEKLSSWAIALTLIIAFLFAIGIFVLLPYILTYLLGVKEQTRPVLFNITDGMIRIVFLLLYIYFISFIKDIRVLFQYHGAEHKAVNCHEAKKALTVGNAKKYSKEHARCGTSFLLIVFIIGIFVFSLIPLAVTFAYPGFNLLAWPVKRLILFFSRIALLPLIAAISYELLKISAKYPKNPFFSILIKPGIWLQKITTREPNKRQINAALAALKTVLTMEKGYK